MPTVPRLNQPVQLQAAPRARAQDVSSLEAFGGGQGVQQASNALIGVSREAMEFISQEKERADNAKVQDAVNKSIREKNNLMFNEDYGAKLRTGEAALGVYDEYKPLMDQKLQDIESGLTESQKSKFRQAKEKVSLEFDSDMQRHMFSEQKAYEAEIAQSAITVAKEDAVANYQTPGKVRESIEMQRQKIQEFGGLTGKSAEWIKLNQQKVESETHKDVIERMIVNGEDMKADVYFKTVKDKMTEKDHDAIARLVETSSLRASSQRISDNIMAKGLSFTAAVQEVKKIDDPKLRDETMTRVRGDYALQKAAEAEGMEKMSTQAYNILDKTNGDINAIPDKTWSLFDGGTRSALKRYAENMKQGIKPSTDMDTYYSLKELASDPETRDQFRKMDLMKVRHKLSDADFKSFANAQFDIKSGKTNALDGWRSDSLIVKDSLIQAGLDPKRDKDKFSQFSRALEEQQMIMQDKLKRKLNNAEMQELADGLLLKGVTQKGMLWDTKKYLFEVTPQDTFEIDYDSIPRAEIEKAKQFLQKRGKPITEDNILYIYTQKLSARMNVN